MSTIEECLYEARCFSKVVEEGVGTTEERYHANRYGEKALIRICCELQRKLCALVRQQKRFRAARQFMLSLPPHYWDLTRFQEDQDGERCALAKERELRAIFAQEAQKLRDYTANRRIGQQLLSEAYAEKIASGKKLTELEKMTKDCFVPAGEEYTFNRSWENFFQLNNLALDTASSVRARLEGSVLTLDDSE